MEIIKLIAITVILLFLSVPALLLIISSIGEDVKMKNKSTEKLRRMSEIINSEKPDCRKMLSKLHDKFFGNTPSKQNIKNVDHKISKKDIRRG